MAKEKQEKQLVSSEVLSNVPSVSEKPSQGPSAGKIQADEPEGRAKDTQPAPAIPADLGENKSGIQVLPGKRTIVYGENSGAKWRRELTQEAQIEFVDPLTGALRRGEVVSRQESTVGVRQGVGNTSIISIPIINVVTIHR